MGIAGSRLHARGRRVPVEEHPAWCSLREAVWRIFGQGVKKEMLNARHGGPGKGRIATGGISTYLYGTGQLLTVLQTQAKS